MASPGLGVLVGCLLLILQLATLVVGLNVTEFAVRYAPYLRFDKKEGNGEMCLPHNAAEYYDVRMSGDSSRQCNEDYSTVEANQIPTYWHAQICHYHLHIAYWSFYGYNHNCDWFNGERDALWESVVVKIRDWDLGEHLHEVRFGQKHGWYTRIPGHYEVHEETHPVAYVGKTNHGFYHDDGGTGSCCYYEDYRKPGSDDHHQETWQNLVELTPDSSEPWMTDSSTDPWNGINSPLYRDDWDLCNLNGCTGSSLQVCGVCGCHKSDTGEDPF